MDKYTAQINDYKTKASCFAYDTCHKIYLIENDKLIPEAIKNGYVIYPIEDIKTIYEEDSCPLRFINTWEHLKTIVEQGFEKEVYFKFMEE